MGHVQTLQPACPHFAQKRLLKRVALFAALFLFSSACRAQQSPVSKPAESTWSDDLKKYPGLLPELGQLFDKLLHTVQFPAPRSESRIEPLLPQSTMSYAAFPNYGDAAHQALQIFQQELNDSSMLRDWWQHGTLATAGPKIIDSFEKAYAFSEFLGAEIVVSGSMESSKPNAAPSLLIVAEARKPGLKKFLQQTIDQFTGKSKPGIRLLDPQELATAKDPAPGVSQDLLVLVRPDFIVAGLDLATLRSFSPRLDHNSREFTSTPFGQRVAQEYQGGVTILAAADMHKILSQIPPAQQNATFQHSGFADMKYLVWEHKKLEGRPVSQGELSFTAPRHAAAAWLAKPRPLRSLDFVSPKALMALSVALTNPPQIFDDAKDLAALSNSNPFASVTVLEQALHLNLKDDLLSLLGGELTLELDSLTPPQPVWKAILSVKDANHLQQTLTTLLAAGNLKPQQVDEGGVTYYTVRIPNANTTMDIGYAFVDGHLIVGSSQNIVAEAVQLHRSGGSLRQSKKFLAALPPGHSADASALFYQDPIAMAALQMQRMAPDMANLLAQSSTETTPAVFCVYGEDSAIREASISQTFDVGAILIAAAVAIPNVLRSKIAANEATAVGSLRTVNTAQVVYSATYPQRGFAPNLATLGQDPRGPNVVTPDHAALLDQTLANDTCTGDASCTKSGYLFKVTALCKKTLCQDYVAVAIPVSAETGTRNFCSASDAVIRAKVSPPLTAPLTISDCKSWPPLQ